MFQFKKSTLIVVACFLPISGIKLVSYRSSLPSSGHSYSVDLVNNKIQMKMDRKKGWHLFSFVLASRIDTKE